MKVYFKFGTEVLMGIAQFTKSMREIKSSGYVTIQTDTYGKITLNADVVIFICE